MIGLDTNVLVRYLTQDDRVQYEKTAAFIEAATDRGEQLLVNTVVLCELEWVLESAYNYSREEIAHAIEQILATAQFEVERLELLGTQARPQRGHGGHRGACTHLKEGLRQYFTCDGTEKSAGNAHDTLVHLVLRRVDEL